LPEVSGSGWRTRGIEIGRGRGIIKLRIEKRS
jgi:hypothetical protein